MIALSGKHPIALLPDASGIDLNAPAK